MENLEKKELVIQTALLLFSIDFLPSLECNVSPWRHTRFMDHGTNYSELKLKCANKLEHTIIAIHEYFLTDCTLIFVA